MSNSEKLLSRDLGQTANADPQFDLQTPQIFDTLSKNESNQFQVNNGVTNGNTYFSLQMSSLYQPSQSQQPKTPVLGNFHAQNHFDHIEGQQDSQMLFYSHEIPVQKSLVLPQERYHQQVLPMLQQWVPQPPRLHRLEEVKQLQAAPQEGITVKLPFNPDPDIQNQGQEALSNIVDLPPNNHRCCGCTVNKCIQRYCKCFANNKYCENHDCDDCQNVASNEEELKKVREAIIAKNENAFKKKVTGSNFLRASNSKNKIFCTCKTSKCSNNHCPCMRNGGKCIGDCKCRRCKNKASPSEIQPRRATRGRRQRETVMALIEDESTDE